MSETVPSIPGIYNYCDRWCERCRFASRCFVFRTQQAIESGTALPDLSASPYNAEVPILAEMYRVPPGVPMAQVDAEIRRDISRLDADPLKGLAESYAFDALPVISALHPILRARNDDVAVAAVETLWHLVLLIPSKTVRALHGLYTDDYDPANPKCDAHGSAKVARLAIKESLDAWEVLTLVGHAAADGVPKAMIERLKTLDAGLAERFPTAMSFVRDGFDTVPVE